MQHYSFLAKVLGSNYKKLYGYEVIDFIDEELKSRGSRLTKRNSGFMTMSPSPS